MAYTLNFANNWISTDDAPAYKVWNARESNATVAVDGVFDGATITFKTRRNGNEVDVYNGASPLSIDGTGALDYPVALFYGEEVKPVITGAGASTSLNINIFARRD